MKYCNMIRPLLVSSLCVVISYVDGLAAAAGASSSPSTATAPAVSTEAIKKFGPVDEAGAAIGKINGLAVSSDNRTIVAACEDGRVHAFDMESGKCRTMTYDGWPATAPAAAPASVPASASAPASAPADPRRLESIALSADGKLVAACGADGVHVWRLADGKYVGKLAADAASRKVSFSRDGKQVKALVGETPTTWNIADKTVALKDKGQKVVFTRVLVPGWQARLLDDMDDDFDEYNLSYWAIDDPNNKDSGLSLCVTETTDSTLLCEVALAQKTWAQSGKIAVSPDWVRVAFSTGTADGALSLRNLAWSPERWTYKGGNSPVTAIRFSANSKLLVSGDADGDICVWPVKAAPARVQEDASAIWTGLGNAEPLISFNNFRAILNGGDEFVRFMMARVRPNVETDMVEFKKLISDLDGETYSVRSAAREKLAAKAQAIWPLLQDAQSQATSTEVRSALEELLSKVDKANPAQERYAVRILERVDTDLSRDCLRRLASLPESTNLGKLARSAAAKLGLAPTSQPATKAGSEPTTKP